VTKQSWSRFTTLSASLVSIVLVLLCLPGCATTEDPAIVDFLPAVQALDAGAYGATVVPCSDTFYSTIITGAPESRSGYFLCWRVSARSVRASEAFQEISSDLFGDQASISECSDSASWPLMCTAYVFTGHQGPVVFLIQTTHGEGESEFDLGFGSSSVPVSQFAANL